MNTEFPLLRYLGNTLPETLGCAQPLGGLTVLSVLHLYPNLVAFHDGLVALGLDPAGSVYFHKNPEGYPYPHRDQVATHLRAKGAQVRPLADVAVTLARLSRSKRPILLIEDGGYIYPRLHQARPKLLGRVIGAVEQTTRGRTSLLNALGLELHSPGLEARLERALRIPILSVPDCKLKATIEPPLIARAVVNNLAGLTGQLNPGVEVAVLGTGAIGLAVIDELLKARARVRAFDPSPEIRLQLAERGIQVGNSAVTAARGAKFVIGSAGRRSVTPEVRANLAHGCIVASTSSENYELDLAYLKSVAVGSAPLPIMSGVPLGTQNLAGTRWFLPGPGVNREIWVLANGYPLNFWGLNGLPDSHSDLVMCLVLLGAAALGARNRPGGRSGRFSRGWNRTAINDLVQTSGLLEEFLRVYHPNTTV